MTHQSSVPARNRNREPRARRRRLAGGALATAGVIGLTVTAAPPGEGSPYWLGAAGAGRHPAARSQETPSTAVVTGGGIVTLITGDRVRVTTYGDGRVVATMLPGSAHDGRAVKAIHTNNATYVIPWLPTRERARLDASLFNIAALLASQGEYVAVTVAFAPGVRPHAVPGLMLDASHARVRPDGSTLVPAHYVTTTAGVPDSPSALRGVESIELPSGMPAMVTPGARTHLLTINVSDRHGDPLSSGDAFVQNVDDGDVFSAPITITNGVGTVSVPEGNYAVLSGTFTRLIVAPDFAVEADTEISMSVASATVHPTESLSGYRASDTTVTFIRDAATHGGIGESFLSSGGFPFRLQPVPAHLDHGSAHSAVGASMGAADGSSTMAYLKDFRNGVPKSMSFRHDESEFAVVPQRFHANGPAGTHTSEAVSFAPFEFFGLEVAYDVPVPGERTLLLQGDPRLRWSQDFDAIVTRDGPLASLSKLSRYTPGDALPVNFAHGPVGPGLEAAYDQARTGPFCILCRKGNDVRGFTPLFSGAGTAMFGLLFEPDMGSWKLTHGGTTLDSGTNFLAPHVTLPAVSQAYGLTATSHPSDPSWQLSTTVRDVWRFRSGSGDAVIPLLMPSYVPRTALDGSLRPGHVRWPLDFGNLGPVNSAVTKAAVSLSTDGGKTWHHATVSRVERNSFAVTYDNPEATGSAKSMSLRVTATDAAGRTVTETAIDAYRLTKAAATP